VWVVDGTSLPSIHSIAVIAVWDVKFLETAQKEETNEINKFGLRYTWYKF
jgi:hypothetical protein